MIFEEFIEKTDKDITESKGLRRNRLYYISVEILGNDIPNRLTTYYSNKSCGIEIRPCRFGKFDVIIWWD